MIDLKSIYLYRMTHIDNISHIILNGITHSTSSKSNSQFVPIGDNSLISRRNDYTLRNGKKLGDYIPFYFGVRMPMLYVLQNGFNMVAPIPAENIVYCVCSVQNIIDLNLDFIFTDGHAVDSFSNQYSISDIGNIDQLIDMSAIKAKYWKDENDLDIKRRKEAEFLVLGDIPSDSILGYITYNENAKQKILTFRGNDEMIYIKQEYYF
jgi:hypothetical protein